ncbi:hypothetical protein [Roseovarius nitratireducens]|uniref:hypothetical protein n=1 Tax=Roseovarius nitratireducens TaxID=2044597 RepID=UPI000CE1C41E|nr:hypothetical protein [Roseovarius nitratireducens]
MDILKRQEAIPASYPATPAGLSTAAAALDADMIWQRIESYIAHRWTERQVIWTVEGPGEFVPDLTPATITAQEVWDGTAWITASLDASFMGGVVLAGDGPYRITADVGGGTVPAAVDEAFIRLAGYMADVSDRAGVSSYSVGMGGAIEESYQRNPAWMARAMQNSGAGDLLRPYRRA